VAPREESATKCIINEGKKPKYSVISIVTLTEAEQQAVLPNLTVMISISEVFGQSKAAVRLVCDSYVVKMRESVHGNKT
jgi:hypothetical protein